MIPHSNASRGIHVSIIDVALGPYTQDQSPTVQVTETAPGELCDPGVRLLIGVVTGDDVEREFAHEAIVNHCQPLVLDFHPNTLRLLTSTLYELVVSTSGSCFRAT